MSLQSKTVNTFLTEMKLKKKINFAQKVKSAGNESNVVIACVHHRGKIGKGRETNLPGLLKDT